MHVDLELKCRRCDNCLRSRASLWRQRAVHETNVWPRTWFGTLTLSPHNAFRTLMEAQRLAAEKSSPFEGMGQPEQFGRHVRAIGPEIGRFIKRVRKNTGAPIRYLLVAEAHKSGTPHFHMLVHQCSINDIVRYDDLKSQWDLGFSQWKLTDKKAASYVCKYLSKSLLARVRASQAYGTCPNALSLVHLGERENTTNVNTCNGPVLSIGENEYARTSIPR